MTYTTTVIVGDTDDFLETGELFLISIDVSAAITPSVVLAANDIWTLEVQTPVGAVLDITRRMPAAIDAVMQLH